MKSRVEQKCYPIPTSNMHQSKWNNQRNQSNVSWSFLFYTSIELITFGYKNALRRLACLDENDDVETTRNPMTDP
jgi:hypothetical protein